MNKAPASFDLIVIGAGPGGYSCAIRAAQHGQRVACVERWTDASGQPALGGTCLQVGCIPSKALLEASWRFYQVAHGGIPGLASTAQATPSLDLASLMEHKDKVVNQLVGGVGHLLSGNGVTLVHGEAQLQPDRKVLVSRKGVEQRILAAGNIVLACGSSVMDIPPLPIDHSTILDSTDALSLNAVPSSLAVVGAGAVGLELGSVWARYGAQVTVIEALDQFLPLLDRDMARQAQRALQSKGLDIRLGAMVESSKVLEDGGVEIVVASQGEATEMRFDKVIVAAGRRPNTPTAGGLLAQGVELELDGPRVKVNDHCQTSLPGVWAIGDLVRGPMLAHKAIHEGLMVADRLHGELADVDLGMIPAVIYTHPEIAWVGLSEQQAKAQDTAVSIGRFSFAANGRALAACEGEGAVKVVARADNKAILGVQAVGPTAAEIVQQALIAMEFSGSAEDLAQVCFAHPTASEVLHEAAMAAYGQPLHAVPVKRPMRK